MLPLALLMLHPLAGSSWTPVEHFGGSHDEQPRSTAPASITIDVLEDGRLRSGDERVELKQLAERIRQRGGDLDVQVRGRRNVRFEQVEPVLVACSQAGARRIAIAIIPDDEVSK
jgi:biopolymer transport protein ExbD